MGPELLFESALFVVQLTLACALVILVVKFIAIAISHGFNSPYLATPHELLPKIASALTIRPGDIVYDLGSGDGRLMLFCAERYPRATFVGIERNPLLIIYSRLKTKWRGNPPNVSFRQLDFFDVNFYDATRFYIYLLPVSLNKLAPRMPSGSRLVSRAYKLHDHAPIQTVELSARAGSHGEHLLHVYEL